MLNDQLQCDSCEQAFDLAGHRPMIIPVCGDTICEECLSGCENVCPMEDCKAEFSEAKVNKKLLKSLQKLQSSPMLAKSMTPSSSNYLTTGGDNPESLTKGATMVGNSLTQDGKSKEVVCGKHPDKPIEYFCKQCNLVVCSKCMFLDHNGHELAQLEDVTSIVRKNIFDLKQLLQNVERVNSEHDSYILSLLEEVDRMKQQQRKNIENGFNELIKRLESRREELIHDFSKRYEEEDQRIKKKREVLNKNKDDIETVKTIYQEIEEFIKSNSDAAVLSKIHDITTFVSKSIEDLEGIGKSKGFDKNEIYIEASMRPLSMHVQKAFEIISKFTLVPSAQRRAAGTGGGEKIHRDQ